MIQERTVNIISICSLAVFAITAYLIDQPYLVTLATKITIFAIGAAGLNLILGFSGLVSFGHAAFFGVGGYIVGILASHGLTSTPIIEEPFVLQGTTNLLLIWPIVIALSSILGFAIGVFSLRTTGVYFIMITLAFAQMIYYFAISWPAYGGEDGLSIYVRNDFLEINLMEGMNFFSVCFCWLLVILFISSRIINSPFGLALRASKNNIDRVTSSGINPFRVQLIAFIISAAITAIAGSLYTDLNRFVSPSVLGWQMSGELIVFIILGGVGRLCGPLIGASFFVIFEYLFGSITDHWQILLGGIIIGTLLYARGGIVGLVVRN